MHRGHKGEIMLSGDDSIVALRINLLNGFIGHITIKFNIGVEMRISRPTYGQSSTKR